MDIFFDRFVVSSFVLKIIMLGLKWIVGSLYLVKIYRYWLFKIILMNIFNNCYFIIYEKSIMKKIGKFWVLLVKLKLYK